MPDSSPARKEVSVLFVCLGNICRSTMAEGILRHLVNQHPEWSKKVEWKINSCGTGQWHIGKDPDIRTMTTLKKHGVNDYVHKGQWLGNPTLKATSYTYIIGMDKSNIQNMQQILAQVSSIDASAGNSQRILLYGQFATVPRPGEIKLNMTAPVVEDPYYGGDEGFELAFSQCKTYAENLVRYIFLDMFDEEVTIKDDEFA